MLKFATVSGFGHVLYKLHAEQFVINMLSNETNAKVLPIFFFLIKKYFI
jgi:hypothetical protein